MNAVTAAVTAILSAITRVTAPAAKVRAASDSSTRPIQQAAQPGVRRPAMWDSAFTRSNARIRPQYLPALARSRLLQMQIESIASNRR